MLGGATIMTNFNLDNNQQPDKMNTMIDKKPYEEENLDTLLQEFGYETDDNEDVDIATMDDIEELDIFY
jgi:hypothetical protein